MNKTSEKQKSQQLVKKYKIGKNISKNYQIIDFLGKGSSGEVFLIKNQKGQQFALKRIKTSENAQQNGVIMKYLFDEIECLKNIKSLNLMRLHLFSEDIGCIYLIVQYCRNGTLRRIQQKQKGKVFSLQSATKIMVDVIKGLSDLHQTGYLHRDIKPQNILMKIVDGRQTFKLGDFGFSCRIDMCHGSYLGTGPYQSPQVHKKLKYGVQVDMWAFGVTFYEMLNNQRPFDMSQMNGRSGKQISDYLINLATDFSYQKFVLRLNNQQLMGNCIPIVEDLFKNIFHLDPGKRITFNEIKRHVLFRRYFKNQQQIRRLSIQTTYSSESSIIQKKQNHQPMLSNLLISLKSLKQSCKDYNKQNDFLSEKLNLLNYLVWIRLQLQNSSFYKNEQVLAVGFNLLKYYLVLLNEYLTNLNSKILDKLYPKFKWLGYCQSELFTDLRKKAVHLFNFYSKIMNRISKDCQNMKQKINEINPKFFSVFEQKIKETQFDGNFKKSYRLSAFSIRQTLTEMMKKNQKSNSRNISYQLLLLMIGNSFNQIHNKPKELEEIFAEYLYLTKQNRIMDFLSLRRWIQSDASVKELDQLTQRIAKRYF